MGRIFLAFLILTIFIAGLFFVKSDNASLTSSIPKVFGTSKSEVVNDWFPTENSFDGIPSDSSFRLSARSSLSVNYDTGKIISGVNINERLPVASTVKIMTALVVLDNAQLEDVYTVSAKAASVGENIMGLTEGERLTVRELLFGLMLVSGNDAAVALSEGVAQTEEKFVELMNAKAQALGLANTKFINASGLDEDGREQYSSAYDMATIAHYVWENYPQLRNITSAVHEYIAENNNHKAFDLYNDTNLLTTYPGVRGIKPGFTWEAGLCLVTYAENDDKRILAVILGSDDRRGEMKELLDYSFGLLGVKISHPALD